MFQNLPKQGHQWEPSIQTHELMGTVHIQTTQIKAASGWFAPPLHRGEAEWLSSLCITPQSLLPKYVLFALIVFLVPIS